jgi:hypothetical protein
MWLFAGISFFLLIAGVVFAFKTLKRLADEKRALENGYHGYGKIVDIRVGATVTVNGFQKKYYNLIIKFRNELGEDIKYHMSKSYDEYETAYLLSKQEVAIVFSGELCALDENLEPALDLDLLDCKEVIKYYRKTGEVGISIDQISEYDK